MKYVIIGNSAAGVGAVEGIRQVDLASEITVISSEPHHTYSRPLISYLLLGKATEQSMRYRGDDFYTQNGVNFIHAAVTEICAGDKQAVLADGRKIPYDKLLVATGSSPFVPPFEGLESVQNQVTFMSLDDARRLGGMLDKGKRVLIVGAGLIGLKCAEGILDRVSSVTVLARPRAKTPEVEGAELSAGITVVDLAPRILSSILDEDGAGIVQRRLEDRGVEFKLSKSVKKFDKNTAVLESGEAVGFDILVLAVGVRPNTALLKGIAGIDRAIVVNGKSETSAPDIYAAGDCTQTLDVSSGEKKVMALLPNAYMQGECAGINMAGGSKSFDAAIPMNAIGFFGLHVITAGNYVGEVYAEVGKEGCKKLFYSGDKLNGYILIGDVEKAGIYTGLIRDRTPLSSIDFALVCERPGLMAFAKEDRMAKLGGTAA
ncbi:MAG: FAD-dependent oxidoreductase [Chitinispirillia bacterium]|nr:FAD-dependent oxidoreductase [Chitinispirillia bacterium]